MKILVTGSHGMLGHAVMETFKDQNPIGWDKKDLDITSKEQVSEKIGRLKPQVIINCAAYTNVDKAEQEKELAFKVNAEGVKHLALAASRVGAILVHYSTDYVFEGKKRKGYTENDIPSNPVNIYGSSKLEGERAILDLRFKIYDLRYYLIRTSWLFGPYGENFVQMIIKLIENNSQIKVVDDKWSKPTYTIDLAKATRALIEDKPPFGSYHLVNEPTTNRYELAKEIVRLKLANDLQNKPEILPVSSDKFPRPAKRPRYSILINKKRPRLRAWKEALEEYLEANMRE
ncbi:MAG: dTDP-4-dehydrorhamnose reductase [Candidatus Portnoybacteria bacterium]|nr:dTDP-4-dehydrorhamnose reductase [Candidatus Portnoybacteria bacterium]